MPAPWATAARSDWIASLELRPDAEGLVTMLTRVATYTPDLSVLSADAGVRQLQMALVDGVDYLDGGWQQLVDGLVGVAEHARGGSCAPAHGVTSVVPAPAGEGWLVGLGDRHEVIRPPSVVLALGSPAATARRARPGPGLGAGLGAGGRRHRGLPRPGAAPGAAPTPSCSASTDPSTCPPMRRPPTWPRRARPWCTSCATVRAPRRPTPPSCGSWRGAAGIEQADVITDRFLRPHGGRPRAAPARAGPGRASRRSRWPGFEGVFVAGDWVGPDGLLADASLASAETGRAPGRLATAGAGVATPVVTGWCRRRDRRRRAWEPSSRPSGPACWAWPIA